MSLNVINFKRESIIKKMLNVNFIEFITKHEDFYNSLSNENKELISNLDLYKDLEVYDSLDFYTYLYVGIKGKMNYFYKCSIKYNKNTYYMYVCDGKIIKKRSFKNLSLVNTVFVTGDKLFKNVNK